MRNLLQDVRYAYRVMIKNRAFTTVAVCALALGIGANTAIFSVVNAVMLRPLPYKQPDELVSVVRDFEGRGTSDAVSMTKFVFWRDNNAVFEQLGAYDFLGAGHNLTGGDRPERIRGIRVSTELFSVLGVEPQIGRGFAAEEGRPGAESVVIVSDGLWKSRYGADPGLVGRSIMLSDTGYTVIGVMPEGFQFTPPSDVWTPLQPVADSQDQANLVALIGRMKPGMTLDQVNAALEPLAAQFRQTYPELMSEQESIHGISYHYYLTDRIRPALMILLGAVAFVLLIACANVANLLLSRAASRSQEIAVRTAMGAPRMRLIRQLLTEAAMMSLAGAALGLTVSHWGLKALLAMSPADIPELVQIGLDFRVLLFTLGIALLTGLLFGVVPALQVSRQNLRDTLHESGTRTTAGIGGRRIRGALVVAEVALSLVLLIGAALLLRSFSELRDIDPGFSPSNVLTMQMSMTGGRYDTTESQHNLFRNAIERIELLPEVEHAATITSLPTEPGPDLPFEIEGRQMEEGQFLNSQYRVISPNYFKAMGIALVRGRHFDLGETAASTPVVIINEVLARRDFPDGDPIGQLITIGRVMGPGFEDPPRQIVGIVGATREFGLDQDAPATLFVPAAQVPDQLTALAATLLPVTWVARTRGEPLRLSADVQAAIAEVDRNQPVSNIRSMEQVLSAWMARAQFNSLLLTIFAAVALFLASIGIYGTMSYSVNQRTHEIGLRMALGAADRQMLRLVVRQGMVLTFIGLGIGLAVSFGITRVMAGLLFGVGATDPVTFAAVAATLGLIALAACYLPARRATQVDPMVALRYE